MTTSLDAAELDALERLYLDRAGGTFLLAHAVITDFPRIIAALRENATHRANQEVVLDDLRALLRALGMFDGARPQSPHVVMQEAITYAQALKEAVGSCVCGFAAADLAALTRQKLGVLGK